MSFVIGAVAGFVAAKYGSAVYAYVKSKVVAQVKP